MITTSEIYDINGHLHVSTKLEVLDNHWSIFLEFFIVMRLLKLINHVITTEKHLLVSVLGNNSNTWVLVHVECGP